MKKIFSILAIVMMATIALSSCKKDVLVSAITLSETDIVLDEGESALLTASIQPEGATLKTIVWTSSDTDVATVDHEGNVTAITLGEAVISATATDGSGIAATCAVTVKTLSLTFTALEASTVYIKSDSKAPEVSLEYRTKIDGDWSIWNRYVLDDVIDMPSEGDKVQMRATADATHTSFCTGDTWYGHIFKMTGSIEASGSIMSLLPGEMGDGAFSKLFMSCKVLKSAPELPATNLTKNCYNTLFGYCQSLTSSPELPATTMAEGCYQNMFYSSGLTIAPELPATTLAENCYNMMFGNCKSLSCIKVHFTEWAPSTATLVWVMELPSTGDFYCPASLPDTRGYNNIPTGWTRHDL